MYMYMCEIEGHELFIIIIMHTCTVIGLCL